MPTPYFSDREAGPRPRTNEEIPQSAWGGIVAAIGSRIEDGSFGYRYPLNCPDGGGPYGCDESSFTLALRADISEIHWPLNASDVPPKLAALDLLEFCHRNVAKPIQTSYHDFFDHSHLRFEPEEGRTLFREDVNRIFARNGLVYDLNADGLIIRLAPIALREALMSAVFHTGDPDLDSLLESARIRFLDPDLTVRKESLEKLWDAWERLKTLEPGKDKKTSTSTLLDRAASSAPYRELLEKEARELTEIGNQFRIRHSETTKIPIGSSEYVDYFFHRLFALIRLLLKATGRGG